MARRRERRMLTGLILFCLLAPLVPPAAAQDSPPIQPRDGSEVIDEPPAAPDDDTDVNADQPVAVPDGEARQVIIFVQGIDSSYTIKGSGNQRHDVAVFMELKQALLRDHNYQSTDFVDFSYAPDIYKSKDDIKVHSYSCQNTAQDLESSSESLRQLVKYVHEWRPADQIVLVGHSLGGAVITYAVAGIEDEQLKSSIASIVTIGSPLHGIDPSDIEQAGLGPAVWWTSACNGILLTSQASMDLRNDFADFTDRREESDVARRLRDSLQWLHDQGGRIGTFGNSYDCVYNHANCGFLQFELDNHFWTQVYPAGGAPLGYSEMYEFVPAPPDCELGLSCIERSHDFLLKRPQPDMLDSIGNAVVESGPTPSQTSYVQILALTCPGGGPDVSFEIGPLPFTIDPVECTAPTVSLTITDAAGNATPIEATGFMNLDLPAGSYTITEQGSGATAAFELPVVDTRETQPPECIGRASCVSIVVSIPSTDAPIPSEPGALHEFFIGSWEGVGIQTNPAIDWPISVTFFPGNAGDVVGTVEYPTLRCGGDLVLTYVDPDDPFQTIEVSEDITYGEENCTDNGTFIISGTEGCCGMTFRWSSPDGGSTAEGRLDPALDDGGGAPGIEPPILQIELTVMGSPPEGWTYAIELTAPDAGALVCQELTDLDGDGVYLSDNLAGPGFEDPTMTFFYGARLVEGYGYLGGDAPGAGMRTSCLAEEVATVGEYEPQSVTMDTIFTPIQMFEDFGGDASDAYGAAIPVTFRNTSRDDCGLAAVYNVRLDPIES